jgi:effector-binding domain-containing protein
MSEDADRNRSSMTGPVELVDLHPQSAAVVPGHVALDAIPDFLGSAFGEVMRVIAEQGLAPAGPPFARWEPRADGFDCEAGFPSTGPVSPAGRVQPEMMPGGLVAMAMHRGDYSAIGATYGVINDWVQTNGYVVTGQPWESYLDEPGVPEPRTQVYLPCAKTSKP